VLDALDNINAVERQRERYRRKRATQVITFEFSSLLFSTLLGRTIKLYGGFISVFLTGVFRDEG
jgi:hypothetical protein